MPTYRYRCLDCGNEFERTETMQQQGTSLPACAECKSRKVEPVLSPFFAKTSRKA